MISETDSAATLAEWGHYFPDTLYDIIDISSWNRWLTFVVNMSDLAWVSGQSMAGAASDRPVHADEQLRVIGELVVWHAMRLNQLADRRHVSDA